MCHSSSKSPYSDMVKRVAMLYKTKGNKKNYASVCLMPPLSHDIADHFIETNTTQFLLPESNMYSMHVKKI